MEISYTQLKANGDLIVLERRESLVVERSDSKLVTRKQTLVREQFSCPPQAWNTKNSTCEEKNHGYSSEETKSTTFAKREVIWQKRFNSLAHAIDSEIIKLKQKRDKIRKRIGSKGENQKNRDVSVQCDIGEVKDFSSSKTNIDVSIEKYSSEHKFACTSPRYARDEQTLCRPRMRTIGVQISCHQNQHSNNKSYGSDKKDNARIANQYKSNTTLEKKKDDKKDSAKNSKLQTLLSHLPFGSLGCDPHEAVKLFHMQCALLFCKCNCQQVQVVDAPVNSSAVVCNQKQYTERNMSPGKEYNYCYNEYHCNYPNRCHQQSTAMCCQPAQSRALSTQPLPSSCYQLCCQPCCMSDVGGRRTTDLNTDVFFHQTKCDDSCTCKPKLSKLKECKAENEKLKKIMLSIMKRKKRQERSGDTEKRRFCEFCRSYEGKSKSKSDKLSKGAGDNRQDNRQWEDNLRKKLRKQSAAKIAKLMTRGANRDEKDVCMQSDTSSSLKKSEDDDIIQSKTERRSRSAPQDDDCYFHCSQYYNQEPDLSKEAQQALKQIKIYSYQTKVSPRRDKSIDAKKSRQKRSSRKYSIQQEQSKATQKESEPYSQDGKRKEQLNEEYINRYKEEPDSETLKKKQTKNVSGQTQSKSKYYCDVIDSSTLPEEYIHEETAKNIRGFFPYNPYQTSGEYMSEQIGPTYVYSNDPTYKKSYQEQTFLLSPTDIQGFPRPSKDEYLPQSTESARSPKGSTGNNRQHFNTTRALSSSQKPSKSKTVLIKKGKKINDLSSSAEKLSLYTENLSPKALESKSLLQKQTEMSTADLQRISMGQRKVLQKTSISNTDDISPYSSQLQPKYQFTSAEASPPAPLQQKLANMSLHDLRKAPYERGQVLQGREGKRVNDFPHQRSDNIKQNQFLQDTQQPTKMKYKSASMEASPPDSSYQTSFLQSKAQMPLKDSRHPPQTKDHFLQRTPKEETDFQHRCSYDFKQEQRLQDTQQPTKIKYPNAQEYPQDLQPNLFSQTSSPNTPRPPSVFFPEHQSFPNSYQSSQQPIQNDGFGSKKRSQQNQNALNDSLSIPSRQQIYENTFKSLPIPRSRHPLQYLKDTKLMSPQTQQQSPYQSTFISDSQKYSSRLPPIFSHPEIVRSNRLDPNAMNRNQSYFQQKSRLATPTHRGQKDFVPESPQLNQQTPPSSNFQQPLSQLQSYQIDPDIINRKNIPQTMQKSRPTSSTYGVQKDLFPDSEEFSHQSKFLQTEVFQYQPTQFLPDISPKDDEQRAHEKQIYLQKIQPRPTTPAHNIQRNLQNVPPCRCKRVFLCPPKNTNIQGLSQHSLSDSDHTIFSCCRRCKSSAAKFRQNQPKCGNTSGLSMYEKHYSPIQQNQLLPRPMQNINLLKDPCQFLPDSRHSSPHQNYSPETLSIQFYKHSFSNQSENIMRKSPPNLPQLIKNSHLLLSINQNSVLKQQMQQLSSTKYFPGDIPRPNSTSPPLSSTRQPFTHNIVSCAPDVSPQTKQVDLHDNFMQNSGSNHLFPQQNMRKNDYPDYTEDNAQQQQWKYPENSARECFTKPSRISAGDSENSSWKSACTTGFNENDCTCQQTDPYVETSETPPAFNGCPCMFNTYIRLLSEYYDKQIIENAVNCK